MTTLADRSLTTDRETARHSPKGTTLYPRLLVLNGTWVRQDADGSFEVVSTVDAVRLLDLDEVAA